MFRATLGSRNKRKNVLSGVVLALCFLLLLFVFTSSRNGVHTHQEKLHPGVYRETNVGGHSSTEHAVSGGVYRGAGVQDFTILGTKAPSYDRLAHSCSLKPSYATYVNDYADTIALEGGIISVHDPVTGLKLETEWQRDVFLRENGLVVTNKQPLSKSWTRHRQVAWAIIKACELGFVSGVETVRSLADIVPSNASIKIWHTQSESSIHDVLSLLPGYISSEYFSGNSLKSGDFGLKNGKSVRHEDLMNPSFSPNELDMVISSEVFEHIPFPYLAHRRVFEILKPGGVHIFTVPFSQLPHDTIHATLDPDGEINFVGEPLMHGDPIRPEGVPVFTIFGQEMVQKLCNYGFDTYAFEVHSPAQGILGSGSLVFLARKPSLDSIEITAR